MPHNCEAALITCEDFRLHQRKDGRNYIAQFIKGLNMDCDLITRGGGIQDLVRPSQEGFAKSVLRDSEVSAKLHNAHTIYLINHEDCGAYGSMNFSSREEELKQHHNDLRAARDILLKEFSSKEIKLFFAELEEGKSDIFTIKELN